MQTCSLLWNYVCESSQEQQLRAVRVSCTVAFLKEHDYFQNVSPKVVRTEQLTNVTHQVPRTLDWQTLKDHVRFVAPNVTRVEVPRDCPNMQDHGLLMVKGSLDASNLFRKF